MIALGVCLGVGAALAHVAAVVVRQPLAYAMLASAQLGVPVAAATVGGQLDVLRQSEGAALVLGALVALAVTVTGGALAARGRTPEPAT
jgi:hypothetical protein